MAARDDHGRRDELAHVALDLVALHAVGRRQHRKAQDVGVPTGGGLDVGDANGAVGQPGQHAVSVRRVCRDAIGCVPAMGWLASD